MAVPTGEPPDGSSNDANGDGVIDDRLPTPSDAAGGQRGRRYRSDGITVYFDARKCWHTGVCVRGLPEVFDVKRRPWIDPSADTPQAVAALIDRCPSGALSYDLE